MATKIILYMYLSMLIGGTLLNISGVTPFNLGVVFSVIFIFFKLELVMRDSLTRKYVYILGFFWLNTLLTTLFSKDIGFSAKYLFYYFSMCIVMLLSLTVIRYKTVEAVIKVMLIFIAIFSVTTLMEVFAGFRFVTPATSGFIDTNIPLGFFGNPNGLACVMVILFCFTYAWLDYKNFIYTKYAVMSGTFMVLFFAMSRAALVIAIAYLLIYYVYGIKNDKISIKKTIAFCVIIALLIFPAIDLTYNFANDTENVINRSVDKFSGVFNLYDTSVDESSHIRVEMIKYVFYNFDEFLFGQGAGMGQVIMINESGFNINPHNLMLELYMDGGVIGILTFACMYIFLITDLLNVVACENISEHRRNMSVASLIVLVTYPVLTSINSGTIGWPAMYIPLSFALMNIVAEN